MQLPEVGSMQFNKPFEYVNALPGICIFSTDGGCGQDISGFSAPLKDALARLSSCEARVVSVKRAPRSFWFHMSLLNM